MRKALLFVMAVVCGVGAFCISGVVAIAINRPETAEVVMTGAPVFYVGGLCFGLAIAAYLVGDA